MMETPDEGSQEGPATVTETDGVISEPISVLVEAAVAVTSVEDDDQSSPGSHHGRQAKPAFANLYLPLRQTKKSNCILWENADIHKIVDLGFCQSNLALYLPVSHKYRISDQNFASSSTIRKPLPSSLSASSFFPSSLFVSENKRREEEKRGRERNRERNRGKRSKGEKREGDNSQEKREGKREGKRDVIGGVGIFGNWIPNWTSLSIEKTERDVVWLR
ncbi:hypothetical protein Bca4012_037329 [Brassica carinata]